MPNYVVKRNLEELQACTYERCCSNSVAAGE